VFDVSTGGVFNCICGSDAAESAMVAAALSSQRNCAIVGVSAGACHHRQVLEDKVRDVDNRGKIETEPANDHRRGEFLHSGCSAQLHVLYKGILQLEAGRDPEAGVEPSAVISPDIV
jgi:hypothetical protein